ncbi:dipeptidase [Flaviaesturariibacter amylovorans]|uniref:Dipeptidase n=1 Tax=Flaviaesturariibacter amylovorans TaxID=1084520 RepID=A0ABP8HTU7_9BACT
MFRSLILLATLCAVQSALAQTSFHESAIVIDTHNDLLSTVTMRGRDIGTDLRGAAASDLARFRQGGVDAQVFVVFCDERFGKDTAFKYANIEIDSFESILRRHPETLMKATTARDIRRAAASNRMACLLGVEGGHMIEGDLSKLDALYRRGVRYMTLTWNNSTDWATSARDEASGTVPNAAPGLNDFGRQVVQRMNTLGMLIDLSHTGEKTFWDVMAATRRPVLVSHSNAWALAPHRRNLKDEQIKAIGKNGGVIHLNFNASFVDSSFDRKINVLSAVHKGEIDSLVALKWADYDIQDFLVAKYKAEVDAARPPLSLLLDHVDHIVKLVGINHVGLGSDYDGSIIPPLGLDDVSTFPKITEGLLQRGYKSAEIRKILGGNFLRLLKANER